MYSYSTKTFDPLLAESAILLADSHIASSTILQRRLKMGYNRASRIIQQLEELGIIIQVVDDNTNLWRRSIRSSEQVKEILHKNHITIPPYVETAFVTTESKIKEPGKASILIIVTAIIIWCAVFFFLEPLTLSSISCMEIEEARAIYTAFLLGLITFLFWYIRETPMGFLWQWYKLFWIFLFAYLMIGYAKKEIKAWWRRD
jgi:hypothetical protein